MIVIIVFYRIYDNRKNEAIEEIVWLPPENGQYITSISDSFNDDGTYSNAVKPTQRMFYTNLHVSQSEVNGTLATLQVSITAASSLSLRSITSSRTNYIHII